MGFNSESMRMAVLSVNHFVVAGSVKFATEVLRANNQGLNTAPKAPKDTGELRASVRVGVNEPPDWEPGEPPFADMTEGELKRAIQLAGFSPGDTIWFLWSAEHANIIEGGRRADKNGRMIGSLQAPGGWIELGAAAALEELESWEGVSDAFAQFHEVSP